MTISITGQSLATLLPLVLPGVVAFIAGVLRQDGLPSQVNEGITLSLVLAASILNALYNHVLTNNLELDFLLVAGYTHTLLQSPYLAALQGFLQSNVLNVIKAAAALPLPGQAQAPLYVQQPITPMTVTNKKVGG